MASKPPGKTVIINDETNIVTDVFVKVAGVAYPIPPGHSMLDTAGTTNVDIGWRYLWDSELPGDNFAPPDAAVPGPQEIITITDLEEKLAQAAADTSARFAELHAAVAKFKG